MNFKIEKKEIFEILNKLTKIKKQNTSLPFWTNVKINVLKENIEFIYSNSKTSIKYNLKDKEKFKIISEGQILVNIKKLKSLILTLENGLVDFSIDEEKFLSIKSHNYECVLRTMDINDYPDITFLIGKNHSKFSLNQREITDVKKEVSYLIDPNSNKIELRGINVRFFEKKIIFEATDSYRISKKIVNLEEEVIPGSIIIPYYFFNELDLLKENSGEKKIFLFYNPKELLIKLSDEMVIKTLLINKQYLLIDDFFKKFKYGTNFSVKKEKILPILKRCEGLSISDSQKTSFIEINLSEKEIKFSSKDENNNKSKETLKKCDFLFKGSDINKIIFRTRFFIEACQIFKFNNLIFLFKDSFSPCLITSKECDNLKQLVLPTRFY